MWRQFSILRLILTGSITVEVGKHILHLGIGILHGHRLILIYNWHGKYLPLSVCQFSSFQNIHITVLTHIFTHGALYHTSTITTLLYICNTFNTVSWEISEYCSLILTDQYAFFKWISRIFSHKYLKVFTMPKPKCTTMASSKWQYY